MSELPDKESSNTTQPPAPCPGCGKPLAKLVKFSVSSLFQTDPGEGLSRWQEYCKCNVEAVLDEDDILVPPPKPTLENDSAKSSEPASTVATYPEHAPSPVAGLENDQPSAIDNGADASLDEPIKLTDSVHVRKSEVRSELEAKPELESKSKSKSDSELGSESESQSESQSSAVSFVNTASTSENKEPQIASQPAFKFDASSSPFTATPLPVQTLALSNQSSQSYIIGGRYEVESVIGKGTFGPTYRARDVATGKSLCLKMVSTPISRHRRIVKRIMQEVEKAKTLNHPNIVAIYDSATDKSGRPFYVMDLVEPGSLKQVIKEEGFLDVPEVLDIFLDVCEGLIYAHEHGILHRDLKPSNILLSGSGTARRAKVSDFGIIKALPSVGSEAQEMTQSTDVFADPSCMSPEQCLGRRVDVRSDIYSLGCSMYEAIIGKKVFSGPNPLSVVVQHFKAAPRPFDSMMYNCDISQDVEAVVLKMLEKSPDHRYQEVSQVVDDLRLLKARKKPTFAYQKKKGGVRNLMLPFGIKDEPYSPDRMYDIVEARKNQREERPDWKDEQRAQIAADINRLARKESNRVAENIAERLQDRHLDRAEDRRPDNRRDRQPDGPTDQRSEHSPNQDLYRVSEQAHPIKLLGDKGADKFFAKESSSAQPGPLPMSYKEGEYAIDAKGSGKGRGAIIRPGKLKLPSAPLHHEMVPGEGLSEPAAFSYLVASPQEEARVNRSHEPLYRASDKYPENSLSLFEQDENDSAEPLVTVEQAKREIPDYLLQISRSSGFATLPMMIALFTSICIIFITIQIISGSH